jgi:LPS-assembly lipoprotein
MAVRGAPAGRAAPAVAAAAVALLAGCGFHLQGHTPLPAVMKNPYVEAPDTQSDFIQSLRHALLSDGAQPVQDRTKATAVVSILRDSVSRRTLTTSALNQPVEYEVTYTVSFSVTAGDKELLTAQEISTTRTYSFQEQLLLAKGHEEDVLRRDMANDLAQLVMRRLSSL